MDEAIEQGGGWSMMLGLASVAVSHCLCMKCVMSHIFAPPDADRTVSFRRGGNGAVEHSGTGAVVRGPRAGNAGKWTV